MSAYARTRGGRVIHRVACAYLGAGGAFDPAKVAPWNWAEGKTVSQIRVELEHLGLAVQFCGRCIGRSA